MREGCEGDISVLRESGVESSQSPLATAVGAVAIFGQKLDVQMNFSEKEKQHQNHIHDFMGARTGFKLFVTKSAQIMRGKVDQF